MAMVGYDDTPQVRVRHKIARNKAQAITLEYKQREIAVAIAWHQETCESALEVDEPNGGNLRGPQSKCSPKTVDGGRF